VCGITTEVGAKNNETTGPERGGGERRFFFIGVDSAEKLERDMNATIA